SMEFCGFCFFSCPAAGAPSRTQSASGRTLIPHKRMPMPPLLCRVCLIACVPPAPSHLHCPAPVRAVKEKGEGLFWREAGPGRQDGMPIFLTTYLGDKIVRCEWTLQSPLTRGLPGPRALPAPRGPLCLPHPHDTQKCSSYIFSTNKLTPNKCT